MKILFHPLHKKKYFLYACLLLINPHKNATKKFNLHFAIIFVQPIHVKIKLLYKAYELACHVTEEIGEVCPVLDFFLTKRNISPSQTVKIAVF